MFDKRDNQSPPTPSFSAGLPQAGDAIPASLLATSGFVKRARCVRCGAPKNRPSLTAYLYCDYCGALVDYDFRLANQGTNAALTNTVYERIETPCRADMARAKAAGDYGAYRQIMLYVFGAWVDECPEAVSPRARTDLEFRQKLVAYFAESAVVKNMDPVQQQLEAQMQAMIAAMPRVPTADGAWMLGGDIGPMAASWKQQIDLAYALMEQYGVTAMDPDDTPPGVAVKMEYSVFCQAWLPHLPPAEGERILNYFGLAADYVAPEPQTLEDHHCGGCGAELHTVVGARVVVCDACGRQIDIASGASPCRQCGAALNFPAGQLRVACPYCQTETQRV